MEHWWNNTDGETEALKRNSMAQCQSVHHLSHMYCPRTKPGPPWWEARTNHLRYGTAYKHKKFHIMVILYMWHDALDQLHCSSSLQDNITEFS